MQQPIAIAQFPRAALNSPRVWRALGVSQRDHATQREIAMAEAKSHVSMEPSHRFNLLEVNWEEVSEPGAYVEKGSGDLYRIPKEALVTGGSPIVMKESIGASRLLQISKDPFVTTLEARHRCAQHNVAPNF